MTAPINRSEPSKAARSRRSGLRAGLGLALGRVAVLGAALILASCEFAIPDVPTFGKKVVLPSCPEIRILPEASFITQFRNGPGRDITDIIHESRLVGYSGSCEFVGDAPNFTAVDVTLRPVMDVSRGPAAGGRAVEIKYFVAVPAFYPRPEGRSEFGVRAIFPENRDNMRLRDEELTIRLPLTGGRTTSDLPVYLGFVLTPEQLEFNRKRTDQPLSSGG